MTDAQQEQFIERIAVRVSEIILEKMYERERNARFNRMEAKLDAMLQGGKHETTPSKEVAASKEKGSR